MINDLQVQQANCFYNYTIGLNVTEVDLLKTATKFLKSGIVRTVCFSDLKALYLDEHGKLQLEWLRPQGRQWDSHWTIRFSQNLPKNTAGHLFFCLGLSFNEQRIESAEAKQVPPHFRAALPPLILERDDLSLPIYPWLKVYADGIMSISFQLDATGGDLTEENFIQEIVNLFQCYFDSIWVQAEIQRIDGEQLLPSAFVGEMSIGGQGIVGRKARKFAKEMRRRAEAVLDRSLEKEGRRFELNGESWSLHQIAGSEDKVGWEATIDLCRSIYTNAVTSQIIAKGNRKGRKEVGVQLWQGRPSISLMRFVDQPKCKEELFEKYSHSISRILIRSPGVDSPPSLPPDLRPFEDYCFHGNRSLLLWTWMRPLNASDDVGANTSAHWLENQARAEHFEYHNMRIARACAIASSTPSDEQLIHAYETLAAADSVIHQSSQSGEITDALEYLMDAAGTTRLIASGKEQARWRLDERRFRNEIRRSRTDRWLTAVFGFVGVAGLADLVTRPLLHATYSDWSDWLTGLAAFALASLVVGVLSVPLWLSNK
ncbi:hypothetical protein SAMN05216189_10713 [Pseudomonas delhiensis]|uniref:Uncharacterized protein n=1 Tax=Pseudomonas delhiensis TaxID=366289 RepID=A0A239N478_9PSED|nr:hypothetical protein [Pseudomonas delhiensis]SDL10903.1 hypothetical protein SAMN05216189_10713 [Pseudomonas delhiensis]SNT49263.1 hypothetical protein SAMN06295949_1363 [Pseudomonas delhiensis]